MREIECPGMRVDREHPGMRAGRDSLEIGEVERYTIATMYIMVIPIQNELVL